MSKFRFVRACLKMGELNPTAILVATTFIDCANKALDITAKIL